MGSSIKIQEGDRYGRLRLLKELPVHVLPCGQKARRVLVVCDCGKETSTFLHSIRSGHTLSCGCLQKEKAADSNTVHGESGGNSKTYTSWQALLQRCLNSNYSGYEHYGGRGINVCGRWNPRSGGSFENFLADMGERPEGTSLDRIDVDGNYEPENCRWATFTEQSLNRGINKNNKSGFKGIYWMKAKKKWRAEVCRNYKNIHIGYFENIEDAVSARSQFLIESER